jgi:preprotein translocase subunit SecD
LPNFFGEVPALQVSPVRATLKADVALQTRAAEALAAASIVPTATVLDSGSLRLRFADTEIQLRAKDVIEKAAGDGYIVALNLVSNSPSWLGALRALPMYLGLDLRGGVHFLLQIDMKTALNKKVESYVNELRTTLREQKISSAGVTREGMNLVVRFRDAAAREKASVVITRASPDLSLREVDEGTEFRLVATIRPEAVRQTQEFALQQNITTLRNRVNELGVAEPVIQQQGADRIVVQLPGVQDTAKAKELLGRTAALEVRMVAEDLSDVASLQAGAAGNPPFGTEYFAHLPAGHPRERQQAHGDPADREGQRRGGHCTGDPYRDRRRPGSDQRPHDHGRGA